PTKSLPTKSLPTISLAKPRLGRRRPAHVALAAGAAKRHSHRAQQHVALIIGARRGDYRNRQALDLFDLVEVELGKNRMLADAEGVVAAPIEGFFADPAEVAHPGQGDVDQAVEELVHPLATQRHHRTDRHP